MTERIPKPATGTRIDYRNGAIVVPDDPIIPYIEGDGIGPDIWRATRHVVDGTLKKIYGGKKSIVWLEAFAGDKAKERFDDYLPKETLDALQYYRVSIKGPLSTPVGGGIRSLNVTMRQILDLYACVRPVRYFEGVPSPVRQPQNVNMTIFRENTEDVYAGIEWPAGTESAEKIIGFINKLDKRKARIRPGSAIGIKPISEFGSKRLVRKALDYTIATKRESLTLVHKGNIMKFTEGAFKDWGYQVAREEYGDKTIAESELTDGKTANGRIVIKDRIADSMFQQVLLRPAEYSVIATTNLNGDYLSDALAAQVGGLGMAPGSNESDEVAIFEATHGTAPKYANKDMINPGSLILSAVMMLRHLKWVEAADAVERAIGKTILQKRVTYDLERQMQGATKLSTSEFAKAIVDNV
jgi:isocitrate dehydrogenase